ncbi:MAG: HEAT repeat domain-containing protein, partial [Planctomycetes bacterium]|nr:HEAT repeat domain-containing protein [Planctomycetota bacterium]
SLNDEDWRVRVAAVAFLGQMPLYWVAANLTAAVSAEDNRVAAEAVRAVVRQRHLSAGASVEALIDRNGPRLTALALDALTDLGQERAEAALLKDLAHDSTLVRLAALRHARCVRDPQRATIEAIAAMAGDEKAEPMIRGEALAVLGKLAGPAAKGVLLGAVDHADWRIRAGAAEGLGHVGSEAATIKLLTDKAGPVRLAAYRAVEITRDPAAFETLWKNLDDDPIEVNHAAVREALVHIDEAQVPTRAGLRLRENAGVLLAIEVPRRLKMNKVGMLTDTQEKRLARSRAVDASYILGELGSDEEYAFHVSLLTKLSESDELLEQVAVSLGQIGKAEAILHMLDYMEHAIPTALEYYDTLSSEWGPSVSFRETVCGNVVRAMGTIDPMAGLAMYRAVNNLLQKGNRMAQSNIAIVDILTANCDKFSPADVDAMLGSCIADATYPAEARWKAAHTVGKLKFKGPACGKALDTMLNTERASREYLVVAGWAVQEITGQTVTLPEPVTRNPASMVLWDSPEK